MEAHLKAHCRKRSRPTASCAPGWPSTGSTACRACGAASTSSPAGKMPWKPRLRERLSASSRAPGHGARLCGRRRQRRPRPGWPSLPPGSGPAGPGGSLPRLAGMSAAPGQRRVARRAGRLAGAGLLHRTDPGRSPGTARPAAARGNHFVPGGHAVTAHSVGFYAQDSESRVCWPAPRKSNTSKELRAQALISDEARTALARAESAYADAAQRLTTHAREAGRVQGRTHELQVSTCACRSWWSRRARAVRTNRPRPGRSRGTAGRPAGALRRPKPASKKLTCSWPTARSGTPNWATGDRGRAQAAGVPRTAAQPGAPGPGGHLLAAQPGGPPRRTGAHAGHRCQPDPVLQDERQRAQGELERLSDAAAQGGCRRCWP